MYALCVSGAVNTQGFVWKFFLCAIYKFSFIHSALLLTLHTGVKTLKVTLLNAFGLN